MTILSPTVALPKALTVTNKYKRSCVLTYEEQRVLVKELKKERPEFFGNRALDEALNMGDGSYRP